MNDICFAPYGATVALAAGTASARVALTDTAAGTGERTVRVLNAGPETAFVAFGHAAATAAVPVAGAPAAGIPVPAGGGAEPFRIPADATHMAAVCASGTATLYVTVGQGL